MVNAYHPAAGPSPIGATEIVSFWDVHEGSDYDVPRHDEGNGLLVLWRVHGGAGDVWMDDGRQIPLEPDSLLLVENDRMRRYKTRETAWDFWWFQIRLAPPLPLPLNRLLHIPEHPQDRGDFAEIVRLIKSPTAQERCLASALFCAMLQRWIAWGAGQRPMTPQQALIREIIRRMHELGGAPWPVEDMADAVHLSDRRFRQLFRETTGVSPKAYYETIRMDHARERLLMGMGNVAETADALGYSSAFHFSKAFKAHFGYPPSALFGKGLHSEPESAG